MRYASTALNGDCAYIKASVSGVMFPNKDWVVKADLEGSKKNVWCRRDK